MSKVFGDIKSLRASDRQILEKLTNRRVDPELIFDSACSKNAATIVAKLGLQIALLIDRDGKIEHVAVGTKRRVYLPDLGRFRLGQARLRRLRLVVFAPFDSFETDDDGAPKLPRDLITDLEKLRLDLVALVEVRGSGSTGAITVAHLDANPGNVFSERGYSGVDFISAETIEDLDLDFQVFITELEDRFRQSRSKGHEIKKDGAVLVGVYTSTAEQARLSMSELEELSRTAGVTILDSVIQRRKEIDKKTVIGGGRLEDLVLDCLDLGAEILIFDCELSPSQLRRITDLTELKIIDRSMLILDIFAQRAKSREGQIQVELAQLKYSLPRLSDKESGLSRLTGGIGGRGPGETKLEIGRRRARDRINDLEKKIEKISMQRGVRRERRQSRGVPVIGIIGYTNAGKSTLLNVITKGDVLAEDKLFATVDTASRRMRFPNDKEVVFVDTVGFIRDLPKELIAAFKATLEEVGEADLLLHLVDVSESDFIRKIQVVKQTLSELGFEDKPSLLVFNKVDILSELEVKSLLNSTDAIPISAINRQGIENLISCLQQRLIETFKQADPGRFTEQTFW